MVFCYLYKMFREMHLLFCKCQGWFYKLTKATEKNSLLWCELLDEKWSRNGTPLYSVSIQTFCRLDSLNSGLNFNLEFYIDLWPDLIFFFFYWTIFKCCLDFLLKDSGQILADSLKDVTSYTFLCVLCQCCFHSANRVQQWLTVL